MYIRKVTVNMSHCDRGALGSLIKLAKNDVVSESDSAVIVSAVKDLLPFLNKLKVAFDKTI